MNSLSTAVYVTKYGGTKVSITCTGYLVNRMVAHIIWTAHDVYYYFTLLEAVRSCIANKS